MLSIVCSENRLILGSLKDLLGVLRDRMGGRFVTHLSKTQNHIWYEERMSIYLMYA